MQTKDITDALGITRERIKYYKKEGVFVPENPIVNGKTEYTFRDFENLKRLVILTKSGLSCGDIKKIQTGAKSLREAINNRQNAIREEIERMTGSLALSKELFSADIQYDSMPTEEYWQFITRKELAGEIFMDIDDGYYPVSLSRDIRCPNCGKVTAVDLDEYVYDQSSDEKENGMGSDIVYSFDSENNYECVECGRLVRINGWIREYPIGAYDSENIGINKWEDNQ